MEIYSVSSTTSWVPTTPSAVLAHIELCRECQDRLHRLTRGWLEGGDRSSRETAPHDGAPTADLIATELERHDPTPAEPEPHCPTDSGGDPRAPSDLARNSSATEQLRDAAGPALGSDTRDSASTPPRSDPDLGRTASMDNGDEHAAHDHRAREGGPGPTAAGYLILEPLGEGGMGVVYKARHQGLNRLVGLKMIRGGSQARSDFFTRFRIEAESVARLRHPNIIQIYDIGEADGLPFVALELLDGGSLSDRLAGNPQPGLAPPGCSQFWPRPSRWRTKPGSSIAI